MISQYRIEADKLVIDVPYCEDVVLQCRKWAGEFVKGKGWIVPLSRLAAVQQELGKDLTDLVEVEVSDKDWVGSAQIRVGWYVLAGRKSRDRKADVYAELVAGEIPPHGGSVKNPRVMPSADARFELLVARDFAVSRKLKILTHPDASICRIPASGPNPRCYNPEASPLSAYSDEELLAEIRERGLVPVA